MSLNLDALLRAARTENAQLREALKFYADVHKYPAPLTGGMGALWADCGAIARAALANVAKEKNGRMGESKIVTNLSRSERKPTVEARADEALRETLLAVLAALVAAVYLLERGGKKAAPSDKMFEIMLADYNKVISEARAALANVVVEEKDE